MAKDKPIKPEFFRYFYQEKLSDLYIEVTDLVTKNFTINETITNSPRTFSLGLDQPVYTDNDLKTYVTAVLATNIITVNDATGLKPGYGIRVRFSDWDNKYKTNRILSIDGNDITLLTDLPEPPLVNDIVELYHYLHIKEGDHFCITENDITKFRAYGMVNNSNPKIIGWDYGRDEGEFSYNPDCIEDEIDGEDTILRYNIADEGLFFTEILASLYKIPYCAPDLGSEDLPPYKINFTDFVVRSFSAELQTLSQAIGQLCGQSAIRVIISYITKSDPVNLLKVIRYSDFFNTGGIENDLNSTWASGINNDNVKFGEIEDPFNDPLNATIKFIAGESEFILKPNVEIICNSLMLSGNVYTESNSEILTRYKTPATVRKIEYELPDPAEDIYQVSTFIETMCLQDSTNLNIKIESVKALNMDLDDTVLILPAGSNVAQVNKNAFRQIANIVTVGIITTITLTSALTFTPAAGDLFHVTGNHLIYDQNVDDMPRTGVIKKTDRSGPAKIQFRPLSEPHEGQDICCYYTALRSDKQKFIDAHSIKEFKLHKKEIQLPDDFILNQDEFSALGSRLLITSPEYVMTIKSTRYERLKVAIMIPVFIKGFIQANMICTSLKLTDTGAVDQNYFAICIQEGEFTTLKETTDDIINGYRKYSKKATKSGLTKNIFNVPETIGFQDFMSWEKIINNPVTPPTALSPTGQTTNSFNARVALIPGTTGYKLFVSKFEDFHRHLSGYNNINVFGGSQLVNGPEVAGTIYYRFKRFIDNKYSDYSNVITVNPYIPIPGSGLVAYYPFSSGMNDESGNGHHGALHGAATTSGGFLYFGATQTVNDYATIPNAVLAGLNDFTFSVWAKLDYGGEAQRYLISSAGIGDTLYLEYNYYLDAGFTPGFQYDVNDNTGYFGGPETTIQDLAWHHLMIIREGTALKFYVDNVLKYTRSLPLLPLYSPNFIVLGLQNYGFLEIHNSIFAKWQGSLDNLFIYNRAVNSTERATLYSIGHS